MRQRIAELEASEESRRQTEHALWQSEKRYRLLAENVADVIWTVNMQSPNRLTHISPSVTRLLGYSVAEAITKTMEEVFTPGSLQAAMKALAEETVGLLPFLHTVEGEGQ